MIEDAAPVPEFATHEAAHETAHDAPRVPAIVHRMDAERRVIFVTIAGDVTMEALYTARDAVYADRAFAPGMDLFIECRVITALPSADEIRALALRAILHHANNQYGRIAIVTTTARAYEAAILYELFADDPIDRLALFTDPLAARAWMDV
jgi:hypothetical protein